jgi:hypothetical protein
MVADAPRRRTLTISYGPMVAPNDSGSFVASSLTACLLTFEAAVR